MGHFLNALNNAAFYRLNGGLVQSSHIESRGYAVLTVNPAKSVTFTTDAIAGAQVDNAHGFWVITDDNGMKHTVQLFISQPHPAPKGSAQEAADALDAVLDVVAAGTDMIDVESDIFRGLLCDLFLADSNNKAAVLISSLEKRMAEDPDFFSALGAEEIKNMLSGPKAAFQH